MFFKDNETAVQDDTDHARSGDLADSSLRRSKASTSGSKNSLSLGTGDGDTGDISDEFDTTVKWNQKKTTSGKKKPKPGGTTRRTWPLDQEKRLRKQFRDEMKQGRLPGRAVCLDKMKKYTHHYNTHPGKMDFSHAA